MPKQEPPGFHIREAQAADAPHWPGMFARLVATGPEPCAADAPSFVWDSVMTAGNPMKLLIAADAADTPQGFLLYVTHDYSWTRRKVCYLLDLYVEPAMRGRGAGRALIERLSDIGRRSGWLKIYWMTQAGNDKAHALYGKLAQRSPMVRYDLLLNEY